MFVDRKYVRKSAGSADRKEAIEFAKSLYDTIRINQRLDISVHTDTFYACPLCQESCRPDRIWLN